MVALIKYTSAFIDGELMSYLKLQKQIAAAG